jgi:ferredoxin
MNMNHCKKSTINLLRHALNISTRTSASTRRMNYQIQTASKALFSTSYVSGTQSRCYHSTKPSLAEAETVNITFLDPLEKEHVVPAEIGKSLLDVAHDNNIELEGACGGELACATCHLIFSEEMYDTLSEKEPEEDDMLDLAFELTDTSRLGCQICVRKDMEGMIVRIPDDGY